MSKKKNTKTPVKKIGVKIQAVGKSKGETTKEYVAHIHHGYVLITGNNGRVLFPANREKLQGFFTRIVDAIPSDKKDKDGAGVEWIE